MNNKKMFSLSDSLFIEEKIN